jgi:hypothetical protein
VFVPLYPKAGIIASIERRTCEHVFLEILDQMESEDQPVSSNLKAGNYALRLFSQRPNRERFRTADFQRAMQQLFFDKAIRNEPYGRKSDIRYRIVRA